MILFPIMLNIIVFDIIFLDVKDALVNATIYLWMLIYILYFNKEKIMKAFTVLTAFEANTKLEEVQTLKRLGLVLVTMAVIFGVDQFFVNLVRHQ